MENRQTRWPVCARRCRPRLQAAKGAKAFEKAEDPIFALENNLPIDFQHYLEHHISQPIMRIFEPMMNNPKDLLSGAAPASNPAYHALMASRQETVITDWSHPEQS